MRAETRGREMGPAANGSPATFRGSTFRQADWSGAGGVNVRHVGRLHFPPGIDNVVTVGASAFESLVVVEVEVAVQADGIGDGRADEIVGIVATAAQAQRRVRSVDRPDERAVAVDAHA